MYTSVILALPFALLAAAQSANTTLSTSTYAYSNPNTQYLTQTNSLGVITGGPSVYTSQPSAPAVVTTQPSIGIIPAALPSGINTIIVGNGTAAQTYLVSAASGTTTVLARTSSAASNSAATTGSAASGSASGSSASGSGATATTGSATGSRTGTAAASSSTGAAAAVKVAGSALVGAGAFFVAFM